jgi:hypothetical protein
VNLVSFIDDLNSLLGRRDTFVDRTHQLIGWLDSLSRTLGHERSEEKHPDVVISYNSSVRLKIKDKANAHLVREQVFVSVANQGLSKKHLVVEVERRPNYPFRVLSHMPDQ